MANNPLSDIVMAASQMKATAPKHFEELCAAIRAYEIQAVVEMVAADGNDLYRAQGKLKTVQQLRKHIYECYELRDTYTRRDQNARQPTA